MVTAMLTNIKFTHGRSNGLMYVYPASKSVARIGNYSTWRKYHKMGVIIDEISLSISHETLHLIISNKIGRTASKRMDCICRKAKWLCDYTGLPAKLPYNN